MPASFLRLCWGIRYPATHQHDTQAPRKTTAIQFNYDDDASPPEAAGDGVSTLRRRSLEAASLPLLLPLDDAVAAAAPSPVAVRPRLPAFSLYTAACKRAHRAAVVFKVVPTSPIRRRRPSMRRARAPSATLPSPSPSRRATPCTSAQRCVRQSHTICTGVYPAFATPFLRPPSPLTHLQPWQSSWQPAYAALLQRRQGRYQTLRGLATTPPRRQPLRLTASLHCSSPSSTAAAAALMLLLLLLPPSYLICLQSQRLLLLLLL